MEEEGVGVGGHHDSAGAQVTASLKDKDWDEGSETGQGQEASTQEHRDSQRGFSEPEGGTSPAEEGAWYRGSEKAREGKGTHWESTVRSTVVTTQCGALESKAVRRTCAWAQQGDETNKIQMMGASLLP